jgi:mannose-1-phosphate guanylyltransferase
LCAQDFVGDKINAGIYVLSPEVLDRIPLKPTSIEREVFPHIAADNRLYAYTLNGYWMDVGQPRDYLKGLHLHLDSLQIKGGESLTSGKSFKGGRRRRRTAAWRGVAPPAQAAPCCCRAARSSTSVR